MGDPLSHAEPGAWRAAGASRLIGNTSSSSTSPRATRHAPRATRHALLATRYSLLATRYSLLATRYSLLATRHARPGGDGGKGGHRVAGDGLVGDHQGAADGAGIGAPVRLDHHALH